MEEIQPHHVLTEQDTWLSISNASKGHIFIGASTIDGEDKLIPISTLGNDFGDLTKPQAEYHLLELTKVINKLSKHIKSME